MKILQDKSLMLRVRNPKRITTTIPNSKELPMNKVVVKWGLDEVLSLRSLNIKAPSPITKQYNWSGQHKPFSHQKDTASFLTLNKKSFCFNEQGTGKTASAIWAADYLMTQGKVKRVLVVCPLSIMDSAWRNDLSSFATHRTVEVAHGSKAKRKKAIESGAEFVVINYDGVEVVKDEIAAGGFDLFIVDEATHYKNAQSKRWKTLNKLVKEDDWLWMMTGTPAAQSPVDAYGLAKLVNPVAVPRFFGSWRDMVMWRVTQFTYKPKDTAKDTVFKALQPAIRFTKEECLDLPDIVYTKRFVEMTPHQTKYYNKLRKGMFMQVAGENITSANAAVNMNKLLQISAGAVYTDDLGCVEFDIKNRYRALKETIDESSQKVLVFVPFKHTIDMLVTKLRKDGVTAEVIRGDVAAAARTDIFARFQSSPDPKVLVIQPQSAAHGVTLTAADTIVWWGPTSSLETYLQANARIHRAGQRHKCTVIQLEGSTVEKRIYRMLDDRIDIHSSIIDLYKEILD
tara:strand:- start:943 stop:2478 length:1536 start_codon:yes stop_codon:yes gene_type:complete